MSREINCESHIPQEDMGISLEGPRATRILPTAGVDLLSIPQAKGKYVSLWKREGRGALSRNVFVKSVEEQCNPSIAGDDYISSAGFRLDIWTDKEQKKVFHFHEKLNSHIPRPERAALNCLFDVYESQVGQLDGIIPTISFCPSRGLVYGVPDDPLFIIRPDGSAVVPFAAPMEEISPDGNWLGDDKFPFRVNFDSPPYCFEKVALQGSVSTDNGESRAARVITGLYLSTLSFDRIKGDIVGMIKSGAISERTMREVFNPYVRLDIAPQSPSA